MATQLAKDNLEKDKNVLGKNWFSTYDNYFSDQDNIDLFIDAVIPKLPTRKLDILYVASASGILGESLLLALGKGDLTITDISVEHLRENKNPKTTKICVDLLEMDLGKTFDLIVMRSSLDYFPSKELQIEVLKIIKKHLKEDGIFINQPAYIPSIQERDAISKIYNLIRTIGNRLFQSTDLSEIYAIAGFTPPEQIGGGKVMQLIEQDHVKRYEITKEDIRTVQELIGENMQYAKITNTGYVLEFTFPILLTRHAA